MGDSGSRKKNVLHSLIKNKIMVNVIDNVIDKIYSYFNDKNEATYQYLINKCENVGLKELKDQITLIEI